MAAGGPSYAGTFAEPVRFHDDKTLYTGVCAKYHFDRNDRRNFNYGRVKKVDDIEIVRDGGDRSKSTVPTVREHSRRIVSFEVDKEATSIERTHKNMATIDYTSRRVLEDKVDDYERKPITSRELASQNIQVRDLSTPATRENE